MSHTKQQFPGLDPKDDATDNATMALEPVRAGEADRTLPSMAPRTDVYSR